MITTKVYYWLCCVVQSCSLSTRCPSKNSVTTQHCSTTLILWSGWPGSESPCVIFEKYILNHNCIIMSYKELALCSVLTCNSLFLCLNELCPLSSNYMRLTVCRFTPHPLTQPNLPVSHANMGSVVMCSDAQIYWYSVQKLCTSHT